MDSKKLTFDRNSRNCNLDDRNLDNLWLNFKFSETRNRNLIVDYL